MLCQCNHINSSFFTAIKKKKKINSLHDSFPHLKDLNYRLIIFKMVHQYYLVTVFSSVLRILENACKDDAELRALLGDSIGSPELMRKRVCHTISTLHAYEGEQCWLYLTDLISVLNRLRKEFG